MFKLNNKLESDSFVVTDLQLSKLFLMNDANYPWFILVPKIDGLVEIIDLSFEDQVKLLEEINLISKILKENFNVYKINIATLGNVVSQLHIHIIGRFEDDATFPKPVWGNAKSKPYLENEVEEIIKKIRQLL